MIDLFPSGLLFIWRPENDGQPLHITPADPGGATAWGVTFQTWVGWRGLHNQAKSMAIFQSLGQTDFSPLYRALFWNSCRCGNLGMVGVVVFDAAVMSGPGNAAKFLQQALGVEVDGEIGPVTVHAAVSTDPARLNDLFVAERNAYYQQNPNFKTFGHGWMRRAADCHAFVAGLISGVQPAAAPVPPAPIPPAPPPHEIAAELMAESPSADDLNQQQLDQIKGTDA